MSNIKKYNEFITEGVSSKVYHFTFLSNIISILKQNAIQTTSTLTSVTDREKNGGKFFYLSLTSSGYSDFGYAGGQAKDRLVKIEFYGDKLNYNLKSKRVDYWNISRDPKHPIHSRFSDIKGKEFYKQITRQDEMEERLITDKPVIYNVNQYIRTISILINELSEHSEQLIECKKLSDKLGIPLFIYTDQKSFDYNIIKNAIDVDTLTITEPNSNDYIPTYRPNISTWMRIASLMIFKDNNLKNKMFTELEKGGIVPPEFEVKDVLKYIEKKLEDDSYRFFDRTYPNFERWDIPISGYISDIDADIHNTKSDSNTFKHYILRELTLDMRRNRCETLVDYIRYKIKLRIKN